MLVFFIIIIIITITEKGLQIALYLRVTNCPVFPGHVFYP